MFIHEHGRKHSLEKYYFTGSLFLATILSFLPFANKMYDWDAPEG